MNSGTAVKLLVAGALFVFFAACGTWIKKQEYTAKFTTKATNEPEASVEGTTVHLKEKAYFKISQNYMRKAFALPPDDDVYWARALETNENSLLIAPGSAILFEIPQEAKERRIKKAELYLSRVQSVPDQPDGLPVVPLTAGPQCDCASDFSSWGATTISQEVVERRKCSCTLMLNCKKWVNCNGVKDPEYRKKGFYCEEQLYEGVGSGEIVLVGTLGHEESGSSGEAAKDVIGSLISAMTGACMVFPLAEAGMIPDAETRLPWGAERLDFVVKLLQEYKLLEGTAAGWNLKYSYPMLAQVYRDGTWKRLIDIFNSEPSVVPEHQEGWDKYDITDYLKGQRSEKQDFMAFFMTVPGLDVPGDVNYYRTLEKMVLDQVPTIAYASDLNDPSSRPRIVIEYDPIGASTESEVAE